MHHRQARTQQDHPTTGAVVSIHGQLLAVRQQIACFHPLDRSSLEQAETALRQVIMAVRPLSPVALVELLQGSRLSKEQFLQQLRSGCDHLNLALEELTKGDIQQSKQYVIACQDMLKAL